VVRIPQALTTHYSPGLMSPTLATGIRETPTAVIDQFFAGL